MTTRRILIVFDVSFPFVKGGAQRRFYEVAKALVRDGWEVDWLTFKAWEGPSVRRVDGIRYLGMADIPDLYSKDGKRSASEPLRFALEILRNAGRIRDYDLLWVGQWPLAHLPVLLPLARLRGLPVVLDWWEVWTSDQWRRYSTALGSVGDYLMRITLRRLAERCHIVTDSRLEANRISEITGRPDQIQVIPNGVPVDEIGALEDRDDVALDIVYLGRLKEHKRADLLVGALGILKERYGMQPQVSFIGDGPEREALEAMSRTNGLDNITFHGFIQDAAAVYRLAKAARMCVITTLGGGGGNLTLLEARGCGLPVVAFQHEEGIDQELIEEGKSGLFVSPPTEEALAEALHALLTDSALLDGMRRYCVENAEDLSWERIAERYATVFREVR